MVPCEVSLRCKDIRFQQYGFSCFALIKDEVFSCKCLNPFRSTRCYCRFGKLTDMGLDALLKAFTVFLDRENAGFGEIGHSRAETHVFKTLAFWDFFKSIVRQHVGAF